MSTFSIEGHLSEIRCYLNQIAFGAHKLAAAELLDDLGHERINHLMPRGTLQQAAKNYLPDAGAQTLVEAISTADGIFRLKLIAVAGCWAGQESVSVLNDCLIKYGHEDANLADGVLYALGTIGGPQATMALIDWISCWDQDSHQYRLGLCQLMRLESGEIADYAEGLNPREVPFDF